MDSNFYKEVLDSIADGVYFLDLDHTIIYWNKAAERLTGYTAGEVIGRSCRDNLLRHVDDAGRELCLGRCPMSSTMTDGRPCEVSVFLHHKLGHRVPVVVRASPMRDDSGKIVGAVEVFSDNGKSLDVLKEMEALRQEVLTDPLTGVGNRRYGSITLDRLNAAMVESGFPYGVLFVDIDHFKRVNDTWGHLAGDKVLTMIAQTLKNVLRPMDTICRWGGEEFLVLIYNTTPEELQVMAERLLAMVRKTWLDFDGNRIEVTVSMGGAMSAPGVEPADVVDRADAQNYLSKESGRDCVHIEGLEA